VLGELLEAGDFSPDLHAESDGTGYFTTLATLRSARDGAWGFDVDSRLSEYQYDNLGRLKVEFRGHNTYFGNLGHLPPESTLSCQNRHCVPESPALATTGSTAGPP
jgi:hypothetical protein